MIRHLLITVALASGLAGLATSPAPAFAEVRTQPVSYQDGDVVLQGYLAWDDAVEGRRPGVLVVHQWKGLGEYEEGRARQLAEMGYAAFALDMYGRNVRPQTNEEAGKQAGKYKANRELMQSRAEAGLAVLAEQEMVDPERIAAIGYCFGGTVVLELARAKAPVKGVVSFHGGLETSKPAAGPMVCKVLALHGADDPHVPLADVQAFEEEMRNAGADWQLVAYGGAVHAFTDPRAGDDPSQGAAYHADADRRSWVAMRNFFEEIFAD